MRIARIAISNHDRVADLDIEIREHAVFVGPNAVGKSTVLRLLDCALGASSSHLAAALDPGQLRDDTKPMVIEVRLEDLMPTTTRTSQTRSRSAQVVAQVRPGSRSG